jgi:hypothetical protein
LFRARKLAAEAKSAIEDEIRLAEWTVGGVLRHTQFGTIVHEPSLQV